MSACLNRFGGLAVGREEEQKRYFREKRLYTLQIESTDACPQQCIYCYAGSKPKQTRALAARDIVSLLDDAARLQVRAIDWLGGDPLMRPDWRALMAHALSLGLVNNVWTSGMPLRQPDVARDVAELTRGGFTSVHVDSLDPATYARLHRGGNARNISVILEGVDNLLAAGKSPDHVLNCITYTAIQSPQDAIETMRWWQREKGIATCLTLFNPAGAGADCRSLVPSAEQTRVVYQERDRLQYGEQRASLSAMDTDKFYCGTMATITFAGDVTPCSVIRKGVANIRAIPFARIVEEHIGELIHDPLHEARTMPAPCNRCDDNAHCWGCRASAFHYGGDADGPDPKCWVMKEVTAREGT